MSSNVSTLKPPERQASATDLQTRSHAAVHFAKPQKFHTVVMGMAGPLHRRAEATDDSHHDAIRTDDIGDDVGAAEAVLDCQDRRIRLGHAQCRAGRLADTIVLGRDDDEICIRYFVGICGSIKLDGAIAAGALDAEAIAADGIDMGLPAIDRAYFVTALICEQCRIDRSHCAHTDNRDLHRSHPPELDLHECKLAGLASMVGLDRSSPVCCMHQIADSTDTKKAPNEAGAFLDTNQLMSPKADAI